MGVADKVQDIHYLRYLIFYIWREKPAITEVRREMILKVYRRLVEWAKDQKAGQGIWSSPEGLAFAKTTIFYGSCAEKDGWFSASEKKMIYRDDPQIEVLLEKKDNYVLESHLPQLRRKLEDLEPFLSMFNIFAASKLAKRKVLATDATTLNTSTNFRQNIFSLLEILGERLPTTLAKSVGDDLRASLFTDRVKQWRTLVMTADVIQAKNIWIEYPEIMTPSDKPSSRDAAIDTGDGSIRLLIASEKCSDVSPAVGRELKQALRTDTLPEQAQLNVERVIEDIAAWLDKNPDSFQERIKEVLVRYLPFIIPEDKSSKVDEISAGVGIAGTQSTQTSVASESDSTGPSIGQGSGTTPEPKQIVLPDMDSQNVRVNEHNSQDFNVISDESGSPAHGGDRRSRRVLRLSEEQKQEIGRRAELLVLRSERNRLQDAGHPELIDKVVDRNADGYDPDGPYDIDSVEQRENGEWIPIKIEVKGHLDPEVWGFELSRPELEIALNDLGSPYYVYLVLNLRDTNVQIHKLDFRKLWREKRLNYQSKRIDIALRPA